MKNRNSNISQAGVTLIELLIVLVIIGVLVVFSVAQFGNAETKFKVRNVARELKINLERARFDSVKRRPYKIETMSRVVINSATSFTLINDINQNGVLEASDERVVDFSNSGIKIAANDVAFPITIVFDRRGKISARDSLGNEVDAEFVICEKCKFATMGNGDYLVSVSRTGTITMIGNNESLQTFQTPTTTLVSGNADINELVSTKDGIPNNGSATPTPVTTPSSTPATTPTATPYSPPNTTPTPTAVPTPTPTPSNLCKHNDRPANTGCICRSPMTLFRNGQCKS